MISIITQINGDFIITVNLVDIFYVVHYCQ